MSKCEVQSNLQLQELSKAMSEQTVSKRSVSTLFTCGRYDEATPSATAYYHSMLPDSEIVIFEDSSHQHHLEKTDEYLGVVRNFIEKIENNRF